MHTTYVEYRKPNAEKKILVGLYLKDSTPRDNLNIPVHYKVFKFNEDGSPVKASWSEGQTVNGVARVIEHKNEQPAESFNHAYMVQKYYRDASKRFQRAARFIELPESVANAIAAEWSQYLDVREVAAETMDAFHQSTKSLPTRPVEPAKAEPVVKAGNPLSVARKASAAPAAAKKEDVQPVKGELTSGKKGRVLKDKKDFGDSPDALRKAAAKEDDDVDDDAK